MYIITYVFLISDCYDTDLVVQRIKIRVNIVTAFVFITFFVKRKEIDC